MIRYRRRVSAGIGPIAIAILMILSSLSASASDTTEEGGLSPESVAGAETISTEQAYELFRAGVPFVDVRNPRQFARRHVPGAVHLNLGSDFNLRNLQAVVAKDEPFVLYCSGRKCSRSSNAADFAVEWGFTQVKYFRDGIVGWRDAGYPMDSKQ